MITQTHQEQPGLAQRRLCPPFGVIRSWYYTCPTAEERTRRDAAPQDVALRDAIEGLLLEFPGYGYRRVTHALACAG